MRIALLSDIHSNLIAFQLAIEDLIKEKVDMTLFLGNYITDGENGNEVLKQIKALKAEYVVLGNREKYILNYSPERKDFNNYKTIANTYHSLTKENISYIQKMKKYYILEIHNTKILMLHGDEYFNKAKDLNMMFDLFIEEFEFDICLFGHTHQYFKQKYRGKIFLNPGSIGQPTDTPTYKYCILEVSDKINIRLKEFEVKDIFWQLEKEYKSSSYYRENYVWASLILYAIRDSYDYSFLFLKLFNEKVNGQELTVDVFDKLWDETYKEFSKKFHLEE